MKNTVIFTGGTIACSNKNGALSPDGANSFTLIDMYRAVDGSVEFETLSPYFILSENLGCGHWEKLSDCVKNVRGSDGVIVTHGTDTLPYTAAYLGLKLGLCDIPVVLVSAAYPLSDSRSNGLDNFRGAVDFIRSGVGKGVFVSYKNSGENVRLHRAASVLPHQPYSDSVLSLRDNYFAEIVGGEVVLNPGFEEESFGDFSECKPNGKVLWLRAHPGIVYPPVDGAKAVLLEGYHSGTLPTAREDFRSFCESASTAGVLLYLTGSEEGFDYESKQAFDELGINVLPPMSPVTAYVMLLLKSQPKI
jgi:L-asparaginase